MSDLIVTASMAITATTNLASIGDGQGAPAVAQTIATVAAAEAARVHDLQVRQVLQALLVLPLMRLESDASAVGQTKNADGKPMIASVTTAIATVVHTVQHLLDNISTPATVTTSSRITLADITSHRHPLTTTMTIRVTCLLAVLPVTPLLHTTLLTMRTKLPFSQFTDLVHMARVLAT